jgi:hypothetical protein
MVNIRRNVREKSKYETKTPLIGRRQVEDSMKALKLLRSIPSKFGKMKKY